MGMAAGRDVLYERCLRWVLGCRRIQCAQTHSNGPSGVQSAALSDCAQPRLGQCNTLCLVSLPWPVARILIYSHLFIIQT